MSTPQHVTKTRFAALLGVGKSYVSNLATQGRLVVNEQGLVDVEASKRLIAQTAGAPERAAVVTPKYNDSREEGAYYDAQQKRMDYEERIGKLLDAGRAAEVLAGYATTVRRRMERVAVEISPQVAAESDEKRVYALLASHIEDALADLSEGFAAAGRAAAKARERA